MTRPDVADPEFDDNELDQVVKALGIRLGSLTDKIKRVEGRQRDQAMDEHEACRLALQKAQDAQSIRLRR